MTRLRRYFLHIGLVAALGLLAAGIATAAPGAKTATHASKARRAVQHVKLVIKSDDEHGKKGSDGKWHDAYLPASFTVHKGVKVVVTVMNYDDMPHSFTATKGLFTLKGKKLNATIRAAKDIESKNEETEKLKPTKTTFTFIARKRGKFLWYCALPCDPWSMTHIGFMKGYVTVK